MSTNLAYLQLTLCNNITHIMVFDINVLCSLMEHLILSKVDRTLTVTKQVNTSIISTKLASASLPARPRSAPSEHSRLLYLNLDHHKITGST